MAMLDVGVEERDLGPIPPPNPGPRNEGAVYAASMVEPMEVDTDTEKETSSSGYESSEGEMIMEELMYIFRRLNINE
jgi:hypothetical protein